MKIKFIIKAASWQTINKAIAEIAAIRAEIKKSHPDVVVDVEVSWEN